MLYTQNTSTLPIVAIANYGPHGSLESTIAGLRQGLAKRGFVDGDAIQVKVMHVGFDPALIPQMIMRLISQKPRVLVALTTPVAQQAKGCSHQIPTVYSAITDPEKAGLLQPDCNGHGLVGATDQQDTDLILSFAQKLMPRLKRVGVLFATAESNDRAMVAMMQASAERLGLKIVDIAIQQTRDIPLAMQQFKGKVDMIYVGASGPIQPALPTIATVAKSLHIPVFNVDETAVKDGLVLASMGVNYIKVGDNAAELVSQILHNKEVTNRSPIHPAQEDHHGFINMQQLADYSLVLPTDLENVTLVGETRK